MVVSAPVAAAPVISSPVVSAPVGGPIFSSVVPEVAAEAEPELKPVPASVFDDDFFRSSSFVRGVRPVEAAATEAPARGDVAARAQEDYDIPKPLRIQYADQREAVAPVLAEPTVRVPSFASGQAVTANQESDELDIPAFLRRGN